VDVHEEEDDSGLIEWLSLGITTEGPYTHLQVPVDLLRS
jgi:hypothetical protein